MIKVTHSDLILGGIHEVGTRNIRLEYKGFTISLMGHSNHEQEKPDSVYWTPMSELRVYYSDTMVDVTDLVPGSIGDNVLVLGIEDLLDTIKWIDKRKACTKALEL